MIKVNRYTKEGKKILEIECDAEDMKTIEKDPMVQMRSTLLHLADYVGSVLNEFEVRVAAMPRIRGD